MMQFVSSTALTELLLILCILDLTVTFILLQEQRRLVDTNVITSVSGVIPSHCVTANFDV